MKVLITTLALFIHLTAFAGEPEAVVKTFDEYKAAILEQKGKVAVGLVSKSTIEEYQRYLDWALSADRKTLESLSFMSRFQVLLLKHCVPADVLKKLDGSSVFVYEVDSDWIGKDGVMKMTLGKVDVVKELATAEVHIDGKLASLRFQFVNEDGNWKFDLVQIVRGTEKALQFAAVQSGKTENEFIFSVLESICEKKVDEAIWDPIQAK